VNFLAENCFKVKCYNSNDRVCALSTKYSHYLLTMHDSVVIYSGSSHVDFFMAKSIRRSVFCSVGSVKVGDL